MHSEANTRCDHFCFCVIQGNGKSLRTERAMAVFPKDWVVAGGPSSAKSGMNGQSDSTNGKNVIYDEMVDELCDADGSDRLGEHNPALAHDVTLLSTLLLCALPLRRVLETNRKCRPAITLALIPCPALHCTPSHSTGQAMGKTLVQRSKEEAVGSPAVWLCVYNAIKHVKHLEAGRRSYQLHREKTNERAAAAKRKRRVADNASVVAEQQEYRKRKASRNFVPKERKRGVNKERENVMRSKRNEANKRHMKEYAHDYYVKHKALVLERTSRRNKAARGTGSRHAISILCRDRVNGAMRGGAKKSGRTCELLGCSYKEYTKYLGPLHKRMRKHGLVIDHIWPIALYDLFDPCEQRKAFNYKNTRLCTAGENQEKGSKPPSEELANSVPFSLWPRRWREFFYGDD